MDYGKLAYLKTQELQQKLNALTVADEIINLSYSGNCNKILGNGSIADNYLFRAVKITDVNIEYDLLVSAAEDTTVKMTIMLDGVMLDSLTMNVSGQNSCIFKTKAIGVSPELHELSLISQIISGGNITLLRIQISVNGKNIYASYEKLKVRYLIGRDADYVAYLDNGRIKIITRQHGTESFVEMELSPWCVNDFDISFVKKVTFGETTSVEDTYLLFITDNNNNLYYCNFNFTNGGFGEVRFIASNVRSFSAVNSFMPFGVVIAVIDENGCYYRQLELCGDKCYLLGKKEVVVKKGLRQVKVLQFNNGIRLMIIDNDKNAVLYYDYATEAPKNDSLIKVDLSVTLS